MYVLQAVLSLISLVGIVNGVFIENAVEKSWVGYQFGQLSQFDVTTDQCIVGILDNEQFGKYNLKTGRVEWIVSLEKLGGKVEEYKLVESDGALLYSNASTKIFSYEIKNGVFQGEIQSSKAPLQIESLFGIGVLILDVDGELSFYDYETQEFSRAETFGGTRFNYFTSGGKGYAIAESGKVVAFVPSDKSFSTLDSKIGGVLRVIDGLVVTKSGIFRVEDFSFKKVGPKFQGQVEPISNTVLAEYLKQTLNLYRISDSRAELINSIPLRDEVDTLESIHHGLNHYLIIGFKDGSQTGESNTLYDLTDYVLTEDPHSIVTNDIFALPGEKLFPTFSDDLKLVIVSAGTDIGSLRTRHVLGESGLVDQKQTVIPDTSLALLMDKPISESAINKVHELLDTTSYHTITVNWLRRLRRHLSSLGTWVVSIVLNSKEDNSNPLNEDEFGLQKLLVYPNVDRTHILAVNSKTGQSEWYTKDTIDDIIDLVEIEGSLFVVAKHSITQLDPINGEKIDEIKSDIDIIKAFKVQSESKKHILFTKLETGEFKHIGTEFPLEDQFFIELEENYLQGYKIIPQGAVKTWKFECTATDERILHIGHKPDSACSSVGIILHDKSVLYKYLNSNLFTVISEKSGNIKIYLIDGVSGNTLDVIEHDANETVDPESISLVMDDNWIVYSYHVNSPEFEQRIGVIDLFSTSKSVGNKKVSSFDFNNTIDNLSSKSFIFPERILSLASTRTQQGITIKSIIALTTTGKILEIPKFILNSRRIDDREVTQDDYKDDFRMSPYEPVIPVNSQSVLNHKQQLVVSGDNKILNIPTNLESTSVLCAVNKFSTFCGLVQPSSPYDTLSSNFNKLKLLFTIFVLFACYIIVKPFVYNKRLNSDWIDR